MKGIAKGCLELLVIWGLAGYGLYVFFHEKFLPPGDLIGAIVGGMFVSWAWGTVRNVMQTAHQRKMIARAKTQVNLVDGQEIAAIGIIHALREPLQTPFRKKECVLFSYNVYAQKITRTRSSSGSGTDTSMSKSMVMGGLAMTPCAVRTPTGSIKILGFGIPSEFPEDEFLASQYRAQIDEYCANTKFGSTKSFAITDMLRQLKSALTDDDGSVREEWRSESLEATLNSYPDQAYCSEQFVPNNSPVCVFGVYSAQKGGLLSDFSKGGLQMFPGDEKAALARLKGKSVSGVVLAIVFALLGTLGAYGILTARENSSESIKTKREMLEKAVENDDREAAEKIFASGLKLKGDRGLLDRMISGMKSFEMLQVFLKNGYNINSPLEGGRSALLNALYRGEKERIDWYLKAKADPNTPQREYGTLPLEIAFDKHSLEIFDLLAAAGAKGTFVTEKTGKPVSINSPEVAALQAYLNAHVDQDLAAIRTLVDGWPESFFESFERGLYNGTRAKVFKFLRGYSNGEAATLWITFPEGPGAYDIWVMTLVKRDGVWKLRREGLDDEGAWKDDVGLR